MEDYEIEPWDSASTMRYPGKPMPGYEEGLNMAARKGLQMLNPVETVKGFSHMVSGLANDAARVAGARPPERNPSFVEDMSQLANNLAEDPLGTAADMVMAPGSIPGMFTGRLIPPAVKNTVRSARGTELAYPSMPRITSKDAVRLGADPKHDYFMHGTDSALIPKIQKEGFKGQGGSAGDWQGTSLRADFNNPSGAWTRMSKEGGNWPHNNADSAVIFRVPKGTRMAEEMPFAGKSANPNNPTALPYENIAGYMTKGNARVRRPLFPVKPKSLDTATLPQKPPMNTYTQRRKDFLPETPDQIILP